MPVLDVIGTLDGYKEVAENLKQVASGAIWKDVPVVPGTIGLLADIAVVPELNGKPRLLTIENRTDRFALSTSSQRMRCAISLIMFTAQQRSGINAVQQKSNVTPDYDSVGYSSQQMAFYPGLTFDTPKTDDKTYG